MFEDVPGGPSNFYAMSRELQLDDRFPFVSGPAAQREPPGVLFATWQGPAFLPESLPACRSPSFPFVHAWVEVLCLAEVAPQTLRLLEWQPPSQQLVYRLPPWHPSPPDNHRWVFAAPPRRHLSRP